MNNNSEDSCVRKSTYFTRDAARKEARKVNMIERGQIKLRAYKCSVCRFFHIGHSNNRFGPSA